MPRTGLHALVRRSSRPLVPLAVLAATMFASAPAQAVPYSMCASLLDSSRPLERTLETGCAGIDPHPDPSSITVTLSSQTFGTYEGTASASSDAFDTVRLFASVDLKDYRSGSYVEEQPGGGIPFAASAFATYRDMVTITGPAQLARMQVTFGVTGSLIWNGIAAQLCYGFAFGGPIPGGTCVPSDVLPPEIVVTSQLFPVGTSQEMNFEFNAVVFVSDKDFPDPYSASAMADLTHTIIFEEMLILGPNDQPIQGITVSSDGGFAYPLSPLNQGPAIPEPGTAALIAAGGLTFAGLRRRRAV